MKEALVPIDRAGRLVLPKAIREELAIQPGDTLKVSMEGDGLRLVPNRAASGFVREGKALVFHSGAGETIDADSVRAIIERARAHRFTESEE